MIRNLRHPALWLFLVLFAGMVVACSGGKSAVRTDAKGHKLGMYGTLAASVYMPLKLGNTWTYRRSFLGEVGQVRVTVEHRESDGTFVDSAGGRLRLSRLGLSDGVRFLLEEPLSAGHKWRAQIAPNMAEHFEIVEDNAKVTVPAGIFEQCLVVRSVTHYSLTTRMVNLVSYAPDVGMIRNETILENDRGNRQTQVLLELESYQLP